MVQALAYHELGRTEEARKMLETGTANIQRPLQTMSQDGEIENWWDWQIAEILRREAETLLSADLP